MASDCVPHQVWNWHSATRSRRPNLLRLCHRRGHRRARVETSRRQRSPPSRGACTCRSGRRAVPRARRSSRRQRSPSSRGACTCRSGRRAVPRARRSGLHLRATRARPARDDAATARDGAPRAAERGRACVACGQPPDTAPFGHRAGRRGSAVHLVGAPDCLPHCMLMAPLIGLASGRRT